MQGIHAVVLAAGRSFRMGFPKALAEWRGRTFVQHLADLFSRVGTVSIVTHTALKNRISALLPGIPVCVNPDPSPGLFSSVLVGLAVRPPGSRLVFVHPVDCPLEDITPLEALLAAAGRQATPASGAHGVVSGGEVIPEGPSSGAAGLRLGPRVFVPVFQGRRGHPVLLTDEAILGLAGSARDAIFSQELERFPTIEVQVACETVLRNVNTPDELAALAGRDGRGGGRNE